MTARSSASLTAAAEMSVPSATSEIAAEEMSGDPSEEESRLLFGGDGTSDLSLEVSDHAFARLEQAVAAGVAATLPGNMIRDDVDDEEEDGVGDGQGGARALVDELLRPYRTSLDAFDLFCARNVFCLDMHERSRRERIAGLIASTSSASSSDELGKPANSKDESGEASDVVASEEGGEEEPAFPSPDEIPTAAQVEEMKEKLKRLRSRWEDVQRQRQTLARQVEEWRAADTSMERASASLPGGLPGLLSARSDDVDPPGGKGLKKPPGSSSTAELYEAVSSAVVGRNALLDVHEDSLELLRKLQQQADSAARDKAEEGDLYDDDMEDVLDASQGQDENDGGGGGDRGAKKRAALTLEEEYARDRGAAGAADPAALSFDRIKRQLREGGENSRSF
jgi:hypothetical protein